MKWIILISLIIFTVSCSGDLDDISTSNASLVCNISVGGGEALAGGSSSLKATQNTPPDYITGITLTAENTEYSVSDVTKDIDFGGTTPSSVSLEGLTVGSNTITAVAKCEGTPQNKYHKLLTKPLGNLDQRASAYATDLRTAQKIYANYTGETDVNISQSSNSANISMETENHRLAVVVENPDDSGYSLKVEITNTISGSDINVGYSQFFSKDELDNILNDWLQDNGYKPLEEQYFHFPDCRTSDDLAKEWGATSVEDYLIKNGAIDNSEETQVTLNETQTYALVANNEEAKGAITYTVKVDYYKGSIKAGTIEKEIIASAADNITRLFYFNGTDLEEGTAIFKNITWDDMDEDNDVITVK